MAFTVFRATLSFQKAPSSLCRSGFSADLWRSSQRRTHGARGASPAAPVWPGRIRNRIRNALCSLRVDSARDPNAFGFAGAPEAGQRRAFSRCELAERDGAAVLTGFRG